MPSEQECGGLENVSLPHDLPDYWRECADEALHGREEMAYRKCADELEGVLDLER